MKKILLSSLLILLLHADEIERIESIVNDITQLRVAYDICKEELASRETPAMTTSDSTLQEDTLRVKYEEILRKKDEESRNQIEFLNKTIKSKENESFNLEKKYKELLKYKENEILSLKKQIEKKKKKVSEVIVPPAVKQEVVACKDENPFPVLVMKYPNATSSVQAQPQKELPPLKREYLTSVTKPMSYRLVVSSDIYNAIEGEIVDSWEEERTFTSNIKSEGWVKITGYFVNRKWEKAKKSLWILEKNVEVKK